MFYRKAGFNWLYSIDTSNPVVHAMKKIHYTAEGLWNKESQKLFELINAKQKDIDVSFVLSNINQFRKFVGNEPIKMDSIL